MTVDDLGNVFVTSTRSVRLIAADDTGAVSPESPVMTIYGADQSGSHFPEDTTNCLTGIAALQGDLVDVTDQCQGYLVELRRTDAALGAGEPGSPSSGPR